jgi:hydroxymethylpyrimidine/phosphomethylpyrimidine kinase
VLDIGQSEDWFALQIALAPCLLGYSIIAKRLYSDPKTKRDGNTYWKWIETYVADDYSEAVRVGSGESKQFRSMSAESNIRKELIEKFASLQSPNRIEELVKIFIQATKMETGFWTMGAGP